MVLKVSTAWREDSQAVLENYFFRNTIVSDIFFPFQPVDWNFIYYGNSTLEADIVV